MWSEQAAEEAAKYGRVQRVLQQDCTNKIPEKATWSLDPEASYFYYCDNETLHGTYQSHSQYSSK